MGMCCATLSQVGELIGWGMIAVSHEVNFVG